MSGSTFATYARVYTHDLHVLSGSDALTLYERCPGNVIAFCRTCGSLVPYPPAGSPQAEFLAGLFDDDPGVDVSFDIYVASRAPWCEVDDRLPRFEGQIERLPVLAPRRQPDSGTGALTR
jgi:hypothetical protein